MTKMPGVKFTACCLAAALLCSPVPSMAGTAQAVDSAVTVAGEGTSGQPSAPNDSSVSLEKAIESAKGKVPVPEELKEFTSDYSEYNGKGVWSLRWSDGKSPGASMTVGVDASSGAVVSVSYYKDVLPGGHYRGLPAYSREQCVEIAKKEALKLEPEKFNSTVLAPEEPWLAQPALERDYPFTYNFRFKRTAYGIPVADQGIYVGINAETGELIRYDSNWNLDDVFPSPQGKIEKDRAEAIFREKAGLELTYFMFQKGGDPDLPGDLKPVYRPVPPGQFVLNAITGEVIDTRRYYFYSDDMIGSMGGGGEASYIKMDLSSTARTPAENKAVEESRDFISAERAVEIAAGLVAIPDGYTITSKSLGRMYGIPGGRVWSLQFEDKEREKPISVSIDARTGELTSFYKYSSPIGEDGGKTPEIKVSGEEARQRAAEFIKKMQPEKFGQTVFRSMNPEMGPPAGTGQILPQAYFIEYARVAGGVPYPENGFRVRVDAVTGEVSSYEMLWWNTTFPSVGGVIDKSRADSNYLSQYSLVLEYSRGQDNWVMGNGRGMPPYYLIYRSAGGPDVKIDAGSGVEVDYAGKPVIKKGQQSFSDISGHPAEADIMLLAREGIIIGDGGKFRPDDNITGAEMLAMLVKAYSREQPIRPLEDKNGSPWYEPVFEAARARGILDGGFSVSPDEALNRKELSRLVINAGGWGKLARISRIFTLDTADAGPVPEEYRGYAAAAAALGLIDTQNGRFEPDKKVTRGEAATTLVRLLKL
ncbi:MAG: S-layer homology domain-containing protein [Bacillota bacterium]